MKAALLSILIITSVISFANQVDTKEAPEPLYAIGFEADSVSIEVRSQGCTKAEHFRLDWLDNDSADQGTLKLRVVRTVPDRCRAKPSKIKLQISLNLPDNRVIHVDNRFKAWMRQR